MKVSFNTRIDTRSSRDAKLVYIRPYAGRAYSFVSTGIYVTEDIYNAHREGKLKLTSPAARQYLEDITDVFERAENTCPTPFDYETWKDLFTQKNQNIDLHTAFHLKMKTLRNPNTRQIYTNSLSKLKSYPTDIDIHTLSRDDLNDIERWMEDQGLSWSTIGIYMRSFRAVYNHLIRKGFTDNMPFKGYQPPSSQNRKKALYPDEIRAILNYQTDEYYTRRAVDFWIICFLMFGKYPSDLQALRWDQIEDDYIIFTHRTKTSRVRVRKEYRVPLTPRLRQLIDTWANGTEDHVFQFGDFHGWKQRVNRRLKKLGKELGIKNKLTLQTARHSAATKLIHSGATIDQVQDILMHQSRTTSENYIDSFSNNYVDEFARRLLE